MHGAAAGSSAPRKAPGGDPAPVLGRIRTEEIARLIPTVRRVAAPAAFWIARVAASSAAIADL
jgi:hypothetical protein